MSMDSEATWKDVSRRFYAFPHQTNDQLHLSEYDVADQLLSPPDCGVVLQLCVPHQNHVADEDISSIILMVSQFILNC